MEDVDYLKQKIELLEQTIEVLNDTIELYKTVTDGACDDLEKIVNRLSR